MKPANDLTDGVKEAERIDDDPSNDRIRVADRAAVLG